MVTVPQCPRPQQEGSTFPLSDGTPDLSVVGSLILFFPDPITCYEISQVSAVLWCLCLSGHRKFSQKAQALLAFSPAMLQGQGQCQSKHEPKNYVEMDKHGDGEGLVIKTGGGP